MGNPKGSLFERQIMQHLREQGFDAERLRLTGKDDEGDLAVRLVPELYPNERLILEAKNRKQMSLSTWVAEAEVERDNYAHHRGLTDTSVRFAVVHKRPGKGVGYAYVTTPLDEYLELLR